MAISLRAALHAVDEARMSQSLDPVRRTPCTSDDCGVRPELSLCERNYQGLDSELIDGGRAVERVGRICRRQRLAAFLTCYARAA